MTFRPQGEKIFSYSRQLSRSTSTKGKGRSNNENLDPQSEDVVEFEAYYVRYFPTPPVVRCLLLIIVVLF